MLGNNAFWLISVFLLVSGPDALVAHPLQVLSADAGRDEASSDSGGAEMMIRARMALEKGDLYVAGRLFLSALESDPGLHAARHGYAEALVAAGCPYRALSVLHSGLSYTPDHVQTALRIAVIAADCGVPQLAIDVVEAVPSNAFEQDDRSSLNGWRAALHIAAGNLEEAFVHYAQLSDSEPDVMRWHLGSALAAE